MNTYYSGTHAVMARNLDIDFLLLWSSSSKFPTELRLMNKEITMEEYKKEMDRIDELVKQKSDQIYEKYKIIWSTD